MDLRKEKSWIILLTILFLAGYLFHRILITRPLVMEITDIFLFLSNFTVLWFVFKKDASAELIIWSGLVFLLTLIIEITGVQTGLIFGQYTYGNTLNVKINGVPLIIALNWTVLIMATFSLGKWISRSWILAPIIGSLLIVAFDFVLEPVAIKLDYWEWEKGNIPMQNYFAWFVISLFFSSFLSILKVDLDSKILKYFFLIQLLFFLLFKI